MMIKAIHLIAMTISFVGLIASLVLLSQGRITESQYPMITILFISNLYLMYELHQVKKALAAKPLAPVPFGAFKATKGDSFAGLKG